ncbi:UNVERIFIED_CONTAM: Heavy metal-associated isoprenylated plant protein 26 [Sesamum radiatum]|uniref:Heavy metal-associated isoprenylated plant protein 26 n=1 Tax=Sesamum radiatum TaxID=300843 RepID=A0AAW2U4P3_SESRA
MLIPRRWWLGWLTALARRPSSGLTCRMMSLNTPYAPGVYDKKAPAGYVRKAEDPQVSQLARASSTEVRYTTAFSDENPAACVVM